MGNLGCIACVDRRCLHRRVHAALECDPGLLPLASLHERDNSRSEWTGVGRVITPFSALALMVLVGVIAWYTYKRRTVERELYIVNGAAFILILLQAASGGAVVLTRLATWSPLLHAAFMALLFICLADACRQITQRSWASSSQNNDCPLISSNTATEPRRLTVGAYRDIKECLCPSRASRGIQFRSQGT